jgi:hypothetical protein
MASSVSNLEIRRFATRQLRRQRWCAAGMLEAKKQFRRVNGHMHLKQLSAALEKHVAETVTPRRYSAKKEVAA